MKFTLNWLKDHLETDAELSVITDKLTAIGLEVEGVNDPAAALADFTVAEILHAEKHPDADKLRVCRVKSDAGELQIVCGAPNARAGIKVALAKVGAYIPAGGFTIKQSKIRGVESCGMLCSADELGLGTDSAGIIELPEHATIGQPVAEALGLNDPVIEIAITPNRGDCLGVYGIARDLAAAGIGALKPLPLNAIETNASAPAIPITIKDSGGCPLFIGRVIQDVTNGPAPDWLQQRLKAIGLRPISVLVDITNYISYSYGRPLHVYDLKKLNGGITVREGQKGETLDALNDKSYSLHGCECVIADDGGVLGLGGVVGGVPSSVTEETTDILLECAWFKPLRIAQAGRAHGIDTDARYRFERTVDPGFVEQGEAIAAQMILELCGGKAGTPIVAGNAPEWRHEIAFDPQQVEQLGGITLPEAEIFGILERLGFARNGNSITPPSWRPDIEGQADLVEEVLRIYGYDAIPATPMPKPEGVVGNVLTPGQQRQAVVRNTLASRGLHETHTWAFIADSKAGLFGAQDESLKLVNPISADLNVMRPSLLPNLVEGVARNMARQADGVCLFEIGPQFTSGKPGGQSLIACAVRAGTAENKQWHNATARNVDCMDAKADALAVLEACGMRTENLQVSRNAPAWYHPGRSGSLNLGPKTTLAIFGELHPLTLQALDCDAPVVACEIFLDAIPASRKKALALQRSDFQPVERDFAFLLDETTPSQELLKAVSSVDKALVRSVRLFDSYQGKGVEPGSKSLALTLRLQADDRTLRDEEIEAISKKVVEAAAKCGAKLRA